MELKDIQVLEWSKKQNAFHLIPLETAIEKNLNSLISDEASDYIPVMAGSRSDCEAVANHYRRRLVEREKRRTFRRRA